MRRSHLVSLFVGAIAVACGSAKNRDSGFGEDGGVRGDIEGTSPFGSTDGDAAVKPACVGLGCKQVACATGTTSVSGV